MTRRFFFALLATFALLLLWMQAAAQPVFRADPAVPVQTADGQVMANPWAGGLNAAQPYAIDLDNDGTEDWVVFDRTTGRTHTFLRRPDGLAYTPAYEALFPPFFAWAVVADVTCDGKKDLLVATNEGVDLYRNTSADGAPLSLQRWQPNIQSKGFSGLQLNLKVDFTDLPAFVDIDGDGDTDVLNFIPAIGGTLEYHRNFARERLNRCDTLLLEKTDDRWGNFEECGTCRTYLFNNAGACRTSAELHAGSALLAADLDGDRDADLIIGEIACDNLVFLENKGTPQAPRFDEVVYEFPASRPVRMHLFPAAFLQDADADGVPDLLVSPNLSLNEENRVDFRRSVWWYKGSRNGGQLTFAFQADQWLQDSMLDFGEAAYPLALDADADGDADLLIGSRGWLRSDGFYASLMLMENIGTKEQPAYQLKSEDFLGLSALKLIELFPIWADLNGDGRADLAWTGRAANSNQPVLSWIPNEALPGQPPAFRLSNARQIPVPLRPLDKPLFTDLDADGRPDLLVGKFQGALEWYRNTGDLQFTLVSTAAGGLGSDFDRRDLSPALAFIDDNPEADLLLGSRAGKIWWVRDFKQSLQGGMLPEELRLIAGSVPGLPAPVLPGLGRGVSPTMADGHLIAGLGGGGLHFFRSMGPVTALPRLQPTQPQLLIYPNPASQEIAVEAEENGVVEIFSPQGVRVGERQVFAGQPSFFSVAHLPAGIYVVRFAGAGGMVSKKLLINP